MLGFDPPQSPPWYENTDGAGTFGPQLVITTGAVSVYATDVDGDGDIDVLSAAFSHGRIYWNEKIDGAVRSYVQQTDAGQLRSELSPGAANIADVVPEIHGKITGLKPRVGFYGCSRRPKDRW